MNLNSTEIRAVIILSGTLLVAFFVTGVLSQSAVVGGWAVSILFGMYLGAYFSVIGYLERHGMTFTPDKCSKCGS